MNNNDILRRIRYAFDYNDDQMVGIFAQAEHTVSTEDVIAWLKKDGHFAFKPIGDRDTAIFLNGWINEMRGKKDGPQHPPEDELNNNIILRKIKIALDLKDVDILYLLELGGRVISKHELSAFFRKPTQPQYRPCQDQILRNFMQGMQMQFRPD